MKKDSNMYLFTTPIVALLFVEIVIILSENGSLVKVKLTEWEMIISQKVNFDYIFEMLFLHFSYFGLSTLLISVRWCIHVHHYFVKKKIPWIASPPKNNGFAQALNCSCIQVNPKCCAVFLSPFFVFYSQC